MSGRDTHRRKIHGNLLRTRRIVRNFWRSFIDGTPIGQPLEPREEDFEGTGGVGRIQVAPLNSKYLGDEVSATDIIIRLLIPKTLESPTDQIVTTSLEKGFGPLGLGKLRRCLLASRRVLRNNGFCLRTRCFSPRNGLNQIRDVLYS